MASKVFHRKTKTGSILKVVREHYLRSDISCGREKCPKCIHLYQNTHCIPNVYLEAKPRKNISKELQAHYIIPDAATFIEQIDVIEDTLFGDNCIVLQTVLNEVRAKNLTIYTRIKTLIASESRRFLLFYNEFHKDTYKNREVGSDAINYISKLIQSSAQWYKSHLENVDIIVISNSSLAGIKCLTMKDYINSFNDNITLIDKVFIEDLSETKKETTFYYPEHLPLNQLQAGIKKGIYFQGKYNTSSNNYLEGTVSINYKSERVNSLIQGRENINRAIHDDIVAIELLPETEWGVTSDIVLLPDQEEEDKPQDISELVKESSKKLTEIPKKPTAKVIGIIRRNWRQYCGTLKEKNPNLSKTIVVSNHLFVPTEKRIPFIRIETRQYETLCDQRIVVAIDSWPKNSRFPKGHYVRSLGKIGDQKTENEVLLLEWDVPYEEFTPAVLKCLPEPTWQIPQEELSKRVDLRSLCVCSVDPPGCTDIDDALHCRNLGKGIYECGVHIADVSYFVKPGSALDLEACRRGTTVYLVKKRIDMIPQTLSSNLCSLIEQKDRLTFSVIWDIDSRTAEVTNTRFCKSIIKSRAAMTYAQAQLQIDSESTDELTSGLRRLNNIAKMLRQRRIDNGALVLANGGEIRFIDVESETHESNVTDIESEKEKKMTSEIESKELQETNTMIEEFMLLANISVARELHTKYPELALLRRHEQAASGNYDLLLNAAKSLGVEIDVTSGKSLAESLDRAASHKNKYAHYMLRMLATRCMNRAAYFCSGMSGKGSKESLSHFGIATDIYTHFTSPIRRYADLIVHRLLSFSVGAADLDSSIQDKNKINDVCDNINQRHKNAQYAGRASSRLHTLLYVKNLPKTIQEDAYVFQLLRNCIVIFIPHLALHINYFIDDDGWVYDEKNSTLKHLKSNTILKQFDQLVIQLKIVDKSTQYKRGKEEVYPIIIKPSIDVSQTSNKRQKV